MVSESTYADARIKALCTKAAGPAYLCPDDRFQNISQVQQSQGILAVVESRVRPVDELHDCTTIVALDGVQDPGNAGTLLRTAAWYGVDAVVAGPGTVDLTNPKVVRAAMGAHWETMLAAAEQLDSVLERLRSTGFTPYAADLQGTPVDHWQPDEPSLLVLGSEAHGISAPVAHQVHERIYIRRAGEYGARSGGVESLNVAVASGIIMHHWRR